MQLIKKIIEPLFSRWIFRLPDWLFIWLSKKPYNLISGLLAVNPAVKTNDWSIIQLLKHSKIQTTGQTNVMTADRVANHLAYQRDNQPYV